MKLSGRGRIAAVGIACVAVGAAFGPSFATAADSLKDVIVKNTADNPVPTSAVGTTQVGGTVNVGNAEPIVVKESGPAVTTVSERLVFDFTGHQRAEADYSVPHGKQLEIQFVSVRYTYDPAFIAFNVEGTNSPIFEFAPSTLPTGDVVVSQPARIVLPPGQDAQFALVIDEPLGAENHSFQVMGAFTGTLTDVG